MRAAEIFSVLQIARQEKVIETQNLKNELSRKFLQPELHQRRWSKGRAQKVNPQLQKSTGQVEQLSSVTPVESKPLPRSLSKQHCTHYKALVNFATTAQILKNYQELDRTPSNSQKPEYCTESLLGFSSLTRQLGNLRMNSKKLSRLHILLANSHEISKTQLSRHS